MKTALAISTAIALIAGLAAAGTIAPGLERQLRTWNPERDIKVLVVLKEQVDVASLDRRLRQAKATLPARHFAVVEELRAAAARTQPPLLASLGDKAATGAVRGFRPHWLINSVVVTTTVQGARDLALRDDVDVIEPDLRAAVIAPVADGVAAADAASIGIAPGVVAVGARRVWDELCIDGAGALVGILDTGVQGSHPALSANWRGRFAPAAECWFDAAGVGDAVPFDRHYHGTHVMGTLAGRAPGDTIGVAPGARWIAANVLHMDLGADFDNAVIAALEFMADPDGDPLTIDDVPDVVHNSWGVHEELYGYFDCDSRWWDAIDACEAAGVVLTWSAGNEGPDGATIRSPADRTASAYGSLSVGSTNHTAPFAVSDFSSRGPSTCGGDVLKPEITAPGADIYSALSIGGYMLMSGTSMAGPHVAGIVALMRAADPDLDVAAVKQILMDTAVDLGAPGADNDFGHGFIDGFAAVQSVMGDYGTLTGTVDHAATGLPLDGLEVTISAPGQTTRQLATDVDGLYRTMVPAGSWSVDVCGFCLIAAGDDDVAVLAGQTTNRDFSLPDAPRATLFGYVRDAAHEPVYGADVTVLGTPLPPVPTDMSGYYSFSIPTGADYEILAQPEGEASRLQSLSDFAFDTRLDFELPDRLFDDFETGSFIMAPWNHYGMAHWTVDGAGAGQGRYSARSGVICDNQVTLINVIIDVLSGGDVEFLFRVSSEPSSDFLHFYVDSDKVASWSGELPWASFRYALDAGEHILTWSFEKDSLGRQGDDAAWIDSVVFPDVVKVIYPALTMSPAVIDVFMAPDSVEERSIVLGNVGDGDLEFTVTAPALAWLTVTPTSGVVAPSAQGAIGLSFDAAGIHDAMFEGQVQIATNDPTRPLMIVPVKVLVDDAVASEERPPLRSALHANYPNPFNPSTSIDFTVARTGMTRLTIYDACGRRVRELVCGRLTAGTHHAAWRGVDDRGRRVASGTYYLRLTSGDFTGVRKMTLMK